MEKSMAELSERSKVAEKLQRDSFWNDEELDTDYIADETGDDDFEENDITAMSHGKLEEHREAREYARLAVWDMPLLSSKSLLCRPRRCPAAEHPLTAWQSLPSRSKPHPRNTCCGSDTRRTWANSIRPRPRWLSSFPRWTYR